MFSVIIPLYNKERHIINAVQSVLQQTYTNFELIIVNDGSTDNGLNSLTIITDPRVNVISQENAGVSAARNTGIQNSKFDYIACLDADDEWKPFFLKEICKLIDKFPDAGWYGTGYAIQEHGKVTERIPSDLKDNMCMVDFFKYSLHHQLIHIDSIVIKKSSYDRVGLFPVGVNHGDDQDIFARLAMDYDIAYSGKVGTYYNLDSDNRACLNVNLAQLWPFLKEYKHYLNKILSDEKRFYIEEFITRRMIARARILKKNGETIKAIKVLMEYKKTVLLKKLWFKNILFCLLPYKTLRKVKRYFSLS